MFKPGNIIQWGDHKYNMYIIATNQRNVYEFWTDNGALGQRNINYLIAANVRLITDIFREQRD